MTNSIKMFLLSLLVAFGLVACGGNAHEDAIKEGAEKVTKITDVLKKITDEATAKEHKGALAKAVEGFKAFSTKATEMGEPKGSETEKKALKALSEKVMGPVMKSFAEQAKRVMSIPKVGDILKDTMAKMR